MANKSVNRNAWIGLAFVALVITMAALASFIAGNRAISFNLTAEIEDFTGRRFVAGAAPVVKIFPSLSAEFENVALHDWKNTSDNYPIVTVQSLRLQLSLFSALSGKARITNITLERPVFYARSFDADWQFPIGSEAKLMKLVSAVGPNLTEPASMLTIAAARRLAFGSISVSDGSIIMPQLLGSGANTDITELDAQISWPATGQMSSLIANAIWKGEKVQFDFETSDLVSLLTGADTKLNAKLESSFAKAQFSGTARLSPSPYFEGAFNAETNALVDVSKWQQIPNSWQENGPKLTVNGQLKADAGKWQLEDSIFLFGSNSGSGSLTLMPFASPLALSGTMDFEVLDLAMLRPLLFGHFNEPHEQNLPALAADLRVSAQTAAFGGLALNNVAASIQISAETSALDINQASVFGGNLQLALKNIKNEPSSSSTQNSEIRILADNIDTKQLADLGLLADQLPEARGTVSAILRGPVGETSTFFENAEGTVKLRLSDGFMPGEESSVIITELQRGGFVALDSSVAKKLAFTELNAEASLSNGNLQISPLKIGLPGAEINLSGAYAFKEDSFALTGQLSLLPDQAVAEDVDKKIRVFVGGSRKSPIISALPPEAPKPNP